jgi:hypothetical protein
VAAFGINIWHQHVFFNRSTNQHLNKNASMIVIGHFSSDVDAVVKLTSLWGQHAACYVRRSLQAPQGKSPSGSLDAVVSLSSFVDQRSARQSMWTRTRLHSKQTKIVADLRHQHQTFVHAFNVELLHKQFRSNNV